MLSVEVADGVEIRALGMRQPLRIRPVVGGAVREFGTIGDLAALGPLEEDEMIEHGL